MEAERRPDGSILAPMPAYGPGGVRGDGMVILQPEDPAYAEWDAWLRISETDQPEATAPTD